MDYEIPTKALECLAVNLILAYLIEDSSDRAKEVWRLYYESGLTAEAFDAASATANQAAMFWYFNNPNLARKMLRDRLAQLTGIPA